jgi:tetraprenyl-beta-curcumene synthase
MRVQLCRCFYNQEIFLVQERRGTRDDPLPLGPGQLGALVVAVGRGVLWGMPTVSREVRVWRAMAGAIPDGPLREDALSSLSRKRDHAEGAALFFLLARRRDRRLLRLLVAYQTIWDFLDNVSERDTGQANARQLHLALSEALDPDVPMSDYYAHHPWKDDGGYLCTLVQTCRAACLALPAYRQVREQMLAGVALCEVQGLNHNPDPVRRDAALQAWVAWLPYTEEPLEWFELAAAASGFLPHVLLALAAEHSSSQDDVAQTLTAYFPWVCLALTMLDSYNDWCEDLAGGAHSYISHYADPGTAVERLCEIVGEAARRARALPGGHRHATLIAAMIAMHLSRPSAWTADMRSRTHALASAGGSLTRVLLPLARVWRALYLKRAYTDWR